jgi:hypothetical protein
LNVRPLDFVALKDPADHACVVIGRKEGTDGDPIGRTWGRNAVVCDPWAPGLIIPLLPGLGAPHEPSASPLPSTPWTFWNKELADKTPARRHSVSPKRKRGNKLHSLALRANESFVR